MSLGTNLQYLRRLSLNMTQEDLAEKLGVSRQTVSKWELDAAQPEMDKAIELCNIFNCSLDHLFREEMDKRSEAYSDLRVENVAPFRYITHTVISSDPEGGALDRVYKIAKENDVKEPKVIGWDFPAVSPEQINVYNMHGYTAALILPEGVNIEGQDIKVQPEHKFVAIHIERPFDNPFVTIPMAYKTLDDYMKVNGLTHVQDGTIPCFETDGETMDVYIACK